MKIKALIVEDNEDIREEISDILVIENFETFSAANGKEALALAKKIIPDFIISDILMPVMNGYDLYN